MRLTAACLVLSAFLHTGSAIAAAGAGTGPRESWNDMQKFEHYIGHLAGALNICRRYGMYAEMQELAKLTPYGRIGLKAWGSYDDIRGGACGRVAKAAEDILQDKDELLDYLKAKYDCSSGDCVEIAPTGTLEGESKFLLGGHTKKAFEEYIDFRHFKAFAFNPTTGGYGRSWGYERPERAVAAALESCGGTPSCRLYAIDNFVVVEISSEEIDTAIAFYRANPFGFRASNANEIRDELREWGAQITPAKLLAVAMVGNAGLVQDLLDRGVDVNAKDAIGDTALMHAAAGGHVETVKVLLSRGADVNAENTGGLTALDRAEIALKLDEKLSDKYVQRYRKVMSMLKKAGSQK